MQRRAFLGAAYAAGVAAAGVSAGQARAEAPKGKDLLELRLYRLEAGAMRERFEAFLKDAAIPAWNRLGIKPVGVFALADASAADLYVLLPCKSADVLTAAPARLAADAEYQKAGAAVLDAPKNAPAYLRVESSLFLAFDAAPTVEVHTRKDTRVFQLRIYESHSDLKARKKIEMFNEGGEIAIFRRVGMPPVFFGEALVGSKIPNLTYMLGFDDPDAQKAAWGRFGADPEWTKLKGDPQYKDTVSYITNVVLRPAACSQV